MGNSLCCSHNSGTFYDEDDIIPIDARKRLNPTTTVSSDQILASRLEMSEKKCISARDKKGAQFNMNNPPYIAFDLQYRHPINFMSFSQRKFLGYRNRYEFDKKRLVASSKREYVVLGYDHQKNVYELLRQQMAFDDEIKFISFLEDNVPSFLFTITYNTTEKMTYFKIQKLNKNPKYQQWVSDNNNNNNKVMVEETKSDVKDHIIDSLKRGHLKKKKKKHFGNMELIPSKTMPLNRVSSLQQLHKGHKSSFIDTTNNFSNGQTQSANGIVGLLNTAGNLEQNRTKLIAEEQQSFFEEKPKQTPPDEPMLELDKADGAAKIENFEFQDDQYMMTEEDQNPVLEESSSKVEQSNTNALKLTDFLGNEYPFVTEEFGKLQVQEKIVKSFLFNNPVGTYLFTTEEDNRLSIYIIKSYVNQDSFKQNGAQFIKKTKISNFRMAKRATLELEYRPKQIEFFGDYFLIIYKRQKPDQQTNGRKSSSSPSPTKTASTHVPYVDIVEKSGRPISRIDVESVLALHGIEFKKISRVKFTRLQWSNRKIEEFEMSKNSVLKKTIITGECYHEKTIKPFIIKMNLENSEPEVIKILRIEDKITCIGYGPYDNGYLIMGLKSGLVLIFDVIQLERIHQIQMFPSPVTSIAFEPTNLIMIGSQEGDLVSFSILQKELHYVYLDLGKKNYCTVALPSQNKQGDGAALPNSGSLFCL